MATVSGTLLRTAFLTFERRKSWNSRTELPQPKNQLKSGLGLRGLELRLVTLLPHICSDCCDPVTSLRQRRIPLWFLLSLCVSATTWLYVHQILSPWADAKDLQQGGLKAQMWDLYPRWVGARELLLNGRNPYGPEVSREIQIVFYGHAVTPEEAAQHVVDEQRFAYPLYVVFLMAPTIYTDFVKVQFWAPCVLGVFAGLT